MDKLTALQSFIMKLGCMLLCAVERAHKCDLITHCWPWHRAVMGELTALQHISLK